MVLKQKCIISQALLKPEGWFIQAQIALKGCYEILVMVLDVQPYWIRMYSAATLQGLLFIVGVS